MTLRPIDLQVMLPKTVEMAKVQQVSKENNEASQNLLSTQFKNQLQTAKQKVEKRDKPEGVRIDQETLSDDRGDGTKKRNKKKKGKAIPSGKKNQNSHIDVKI